MQLRWFHLLIFLPSFVVAQPTDISNVVFNNHSFRVRPISARTNLPQRQVNAIFQDSKSFIWISTSQGLYCVQGDRSTLYNKEIHEGTPPLPSSNVLGAAEDPHGNLWVCTSEGIVCLNESKSAILEKEKLPVNDSILNIYHSRLTQGPSQSVVFTAGKSIFQYDHTGLNLLAEMPEQSGAVLNLYYEPTNNSIFLITFAGLYGLSLDPKSYNFLEYLDYYIPKKPAPAPLSYFNFNLVFYPEGSAKLLINDNSKREVFVLPKIKEELFLKHSEIEPVSAVLEFWRSRYGENSEFQFLKNGKINFVFKDKAGVYWVSTAVGIFLVEPTQTQSFHQLPELELKSIRSIVSTPSNGLWVTAYDGSYFFKNHLLAHTNKELYSIRKTLPYDNEQYLIGFEAPDGLRLYNLQQKADNTVFPRKMVKFCYDLLHSNNRFYALASGNRIFTISNEPKEGIIDSLIINRYLESSVNAPIARLRQTSDGKTWAMGNAGLYELQLLPDERPKQVQPSLPKEIITESLTEMIEDDEGNYWFGSLNNGVIYYRKKERTIKWIRKLDGLASNTVFSMILSPSRQIMWIGTAKGLSAINVSDFTIFNFHEPDGLASNEFNTGATFLSDDGIVYMGGINGVTWFKPEEIELKLERVQVMCHVVLSDLNNKKRIPYFPVCNEQIVSPAGMEVIEITLSGNDYFDHSKSFRYRFSSGEWVYMDNLDQIRFTNLRPKIYNLEVQAMSAAGAWGESFFLTFDIQPHFYETWWFYIFVIASIVGAVYFLFRSKLNAVQRELEIRQNIADDIHDNLGNKIYILRAIAHKLSQAPSDAEAISELKTQLSTAGSQVMNNVRDMIWAIEPHMDKLYSLIHRISTFTQQFIAPLTGELVFINNADPNLHFKLSQSSKLDILMVTQEVLSNMVKHTQSDQITITIYTVENQLHLKIQNRIRAAHPSFVKEEGGIGRESIKRRLNRLGASVHFNMEDKLQTALLILPTR